MSVACSSSSPHLLSSSPPPPAQPRPSTHSGLCRTSTTTIHAQCSLPDLNHDHHRQCSLPDLNRGYPRPVFPAGPQPRPSTPSVPCRTSTASIHAKCSLPDLMSEDMGQRMCRRKLERMSDKYVIYYLQTRACVVECPGQCHFLLCRWQSLKQSV